MSPKATFFLWSGIAVVVIFGAIMLTRMTRIEPGYVGLIVNMAGSDRSYVETVEPGLYFLNFTERVYEFPTFKQSYSFTDDSTEGEKQDQAFLLQTSDGLEFKARVAVIYTLKKDKIANIFQEYRMGIDEITQKYMRTVIRNEFINLTSQRKIDDVIGYGKNTLLDTLNRRVRTILDPKGIIVESISLIGSFDLPKAIKDQIEMKLKAIQISEQREIELRESYAQARKDSVQAAGYAMAQIIRAKADGEANRLKMATLNPLLVQMEAIQKWNGYLPTYMTSGTGMPFIGNLTK